MNIIDARLQHACLLADLSRQLSVDRTAAEHTGFVEYNLTASDYRGRLDGNDMAFLALEKGIPVGFSIAFNDIFLDYLTETNAKIASDRIVSKVLGFGKPFVYIDQIGVLPEHRAHGAANRLYCAVESAAELYHAGRICCAIAHQPWENSHSRRLAAIKGFRYVEEERTDSGLLFGIYEKRL